MGRKYKLKSLEEIRKYRAFKKSRENKTLKLKTFIERKRVEGDKSIACRLEYKKYGIAKIHRHVEREAKSLNGRNSGEIINYPTPKWAKAKFEVTPDHRVKQKGKDYFRVTRDLKILYADNPSKYPAIFYPETLKSNENRL